MSLITGILSISAPLLLASMAALISELSGCMALFLDGLINLCAFLCFAFTVHTNSVYLGIALSASVSTVFIITMAFVIEKLNANRFLAALAINLLCSALCSTLSSIIFKTRGVLTATSFVFPAIQTRFVTSISAYLVVTVLCLFLKFTKTGLYIRICGSDAQVLHAKGTDVTKIRLIAWGIAGLAGAFAGCILSLRISSFVPNISSGIGWTALAVVFLGKKNTAAIVSAVLIFAAAQYGSNNIQNIAALKSIPSAVLLSLPYFCSLLLILIFPQIQPAELLQKIQHFRHQKSQRT